MQDAATNTQPITQVPLDRTDVISVSDNIPPAYKLGLSPRALAVTVPFAEIVSNCHIDNVVDIGSGKGYLARILANHYHLRVVCSDKNTERLRSTLRWDRLLRSSMPSTTETVVLGESSKISGNICTIRSEINSAEQLSATLQKSLSFFHSQDEILITGLKLCGDFPYSLIDQLVQIASTERFSAISIHFLLVPCCLHQVERFPLSKKTQPSEHPSEALIRQDFLNYLLDQPIVDVSVRYVNDGYYVYEGRLPASQGSADLS